MPILIRGPYSIWTSIVYKAIFISSVSIKQKLYNRVFRVIKGKDCACSTNSIHLEKNNTNIVCTSRLLSVYS